MALTKIPIELSSTPSIVDGGNATAITIDSSESVGIGTSTPSNYYTGADNLVIHQASGEAGMTISTASNTSGALYFADGTSGDAQYMGGLAYNHSTNVLALVSGGVAKAHLDGSGRLIVGGGITLGNGQTYAAANTISDYETGTWTPTSDVGVTTNTTCRYVKIGSMVQATFDVTLASSSSGSTAKINNLPFNCQTYGSGYTGWQNIGVGVMVHCLGSNANFYNVVSGAALNYANTSTKRFIGTVVYIAS